VIYCRHKDKKLAETHGVKALHLEQDYVSGLFVDASWDASRARCHCRSLTSGQAGEPTPSDIVGQFPFLRNRCANGQLHRRGRRYGVRDKAKSMHAVSAAPYQNFMAAIGRLQGGYIDALRWAMPTSA